MTELETAVHTYLTTAPSSEFYGREVRIKHGWEGRDNLLWRLESSGTEAVLKLFLDAGQARSRRQFSGQRLFAPLDLAPHPLWVDRYPVGLSRQVLVYRWAPGTSLDVDDSSQRDALASGLAQIHAGDPEEVGRLSPNPINLDYLWQLLHNSAQHARRWLADYETTLAPSFDQLAAAAAALIESALPLWQGVPPVPIHGDLRLENILYTAGTVTLVDWEMFGLGEAAQEVAGFLHAAQVELTEDAGSDWLDRYLSRMDQPGLARRIDIYRTILPFRDLCFMLDGLRELVSSPAELAGRRDALPFLAETLAETARRTSHALRSGSDEDGIDFAQGVSDLFAAIDEKIASKEVVGNSIS